MPFEDIADVPEDALWEQITDRDIEAIVPGTEVYELSWTVTINGLLYNFKWRVFIDPDTFLPKRCEWYRKVNNEEEYTFIEYKEITYPAEIEINALIESIFGTSAISNKMKKSVF